MDTEDMILSADQAGASVRLDQLKKVLLVREQRISVSPLEFRLIEALLEREGRVVSSDELIQEIWATSPNNTAAFATPLKSLVQRVRRKIELEPGNPKRLLCVRGFGYILYVTKD